MMVIKSLKQVLAIVMLSGIAITAFAEDAPVYDVDNYPPQFDGQPDGAASSGGQPPAPQAQTMPRAAAPSMPDATQAMPQSLPMDQRMNRIEQQMTNLQHSDSGTRLNALQNEVQSLRGQVEELTHQLQQMQTQQRSMYSDLDKRLSKHPVADAVTPAPATNTDNIVPTPTSTPKALPKKTSSSKNTKAISVAASIPAGDEPPMDDQPVVAPKTVAVKTAAPVAQANKADPSANAEQELQMYQSAYDLIKDSKFDQAIAVLQNMLKKYPSGQSAANAHYWLGELYGLQKKRDQAAVEFASVVNNYPDSPKVSDAEVKLGMIYAAQFKWAESKTTFKKVITHYPGTTSARLAAQQLKEIKAGGH
jgi:tol-pal system protein YbgF